MLLFRLLILISLLLLSSLTAFSQTVQLYSSDFFPSKPYGGEKEVKRLVRQEMNYPKEILERNFSGSVFIRFKVDKKGNVVERKVANPSEDLLESEALFLFDLILWEPNASKDDEFLQEEKIRFDFIPKKFKRLANKRGYTERPQPVKINSSSRKYFNLSQVDSEPYLLKYENMTDFVQTNFKYPSIAVQQNIQGKVTAEFIIEKTGKTSNIRIINPLPGGCNEEMKRLIDLMEWYPSTINNEAVRTLYSYELNFRHPGGIVR